MTESTQIQPGTQPKAALNPAELDRLEAFWPVSQQAREILGGKKGYDLGRWVQSDARRLVTNAAKVAQAQDTIERLTRPASRDFLAGRVAALLLHSFVTDVPEAFQKLVANDWLAELNGLPEWAVSRAARWWISADNPHRRQRPVPGDISARAKREMWLVDFLRYAIKQREEDAREAFHPGAQGIVRATETAEQAAQRKAAIAELVAKCFPGSHAARQEAEAREAEQAGSDE